QDCSSFLAGPEHLDTLKTMNNLAFHYSRTHRLQEASKLLEEALPLCQRIEGLQGSLAARNQRHFKF
ncbi:MAG: tetratricopeptide repeat protein, partial [Leptolyngbya sp.]|nr:tetratricopeptide repeat protein [Candidatus Melainabacteria bacterium]